MAAIFVENDIYDNNILVSCKNLKHKLQVKNSCLLKNDLAQIRKCWKRNSKHKQYVVDAKKQRTTYSKFALGGQKITLLVLSCKIEVLCKPTKMNFARNLAREKWASMTYHMMCSDVRTDTYYCMF